jgi:hypothetical protein
MFKEMTDATFRKVGKSGKRMYGPPSILICGYGADEQAQILSLIQDSGLSGRPVVFACESDANTTLRELTEMETGKGQGVSSRLARAIIMSGFTEKELHSLLSSYRKGGFTPQLWATLTPISETWTLKALLEELASEAEAFRKGQRG